MHELIDNKVGLGRSGPRETKCAMNFLLSALGSAGDVHPFVALGRVLLERGHSVRLLAAPPYEARVREAGIDFRPVGTPGDFERMVQRAELWDPRRGTEFLIDQLLEHLPEALACTADAVQDADTVLVGSTLSWSMRLLQEQRGLRAATMHLSPMCVTSAIDPAVLPGVGDLSWMPSWALRWLQRGAERWWLDPLAAPRLNALRARLGLSPVRRVLSQWAHSPQLVICAWPAWFAPPQADWPAHAMTTGFPLLSESALPQAGLEAFLAAGPPPIGITPGSAMAHGADFLRLALGACVRLGRRALVITPYREQLPAPWPSSAMHVDYAPFTGLLPRLAALVHHGGIGTSAQAIAAGIPQLVLPFAHDQFDNAARLARLGVALTLRPTSSEPSIERALRTVLGDPSVEQAAVRLAARMNDDELPAISIARHLEDLGGQRTASPTRGHATK